MLVDRILRVEEPLDGFYRELDADPVFGGGIAELGRGDALVLQPVVDLN